MVHLTWSGWLHPVRERQKYCPSIARKHFRGMGCVLPITLVAEKLHIHTSHDQEEKVNSYTNRYHAFLSVKIIVTELQEIQKGAFISDGNTSVSLTFSNVINF